MGAVAAGYHGVRARPRPEGLDPRWVRDPLLTLAPDLAPRGPRLTWAGLADADLAALGVPPERMAAARAWTDELERAGRIGFPDVCHDPEAVAEFAGRFVPGGGLAVLGVGLDAGRVDAFLAEQAAAVGQDDGIVVLLRRRRPLVPGYRVLGYEPVAVDHGGLGCSWTCNRLQVAVASATGIEPNEWGLLATAEEADAVMAFLADPAVGKEPGVWRAWLVVRYDAGPSPAPPTLAP